MVQAGKVGDVEVKERLIEALEHLLEPMRQRRATFESRSGYVDELIENGTIKTRREVQETVLVARKAMGLSAVWNQIRRKAERSRKKSDEVGAS